MSVGYKEAYMRGGDNVIYTSSNLGNIIKGKTAFTSRPDQIKWGGLWKFNPLTLSTVPSTIMTPIPMFTLDITAGAAGLGKSMTGTLRSLGTSIAKAIGGI